ncbi:MAG: 6-bladed beta-propeller [Caldilineaceae bacterium]
MHVNLRDALLSEQPQTLYPPILVGPSTVRYTWTDQWVRIPQTASGRIDGRTHGLAVTQGGQLILFHQADPAVVIYSSEGVLVDAWGDNFPGAHGLTLVQEGDEEFLWLADSKTGEVAKTTLSGRTVLNLQRPALSIYANSKYAPTWVAVHEERHGGNGDIWVTDGYGASYIHCYDKVGHYIDSINGTEGGAGAFKCPHSIFMDTRKTQPELYIADRGNRRVQVYDVEGNYLRVFGADFLTSPCAFAISGERLIIPELRARVAILDGQDRLLGYLGENEATCEQPGWPNHSAEWIHPGKFNSPHGVAVDAQGNLYIAEWIIGGRVTKLTPVGFTPSI